MAIINIVFVKEYRGGQARVGSVGWLVLPGVGMGIGWIWIGLVVIYLKILFGLENAHHYFLFEVSSVESENKQGYANKGE